MAVASTDGKIIETAFKTYNDLLALRPTLSPGPNEWTNFAAIVLRSISPPTEVDEQSMVSFTADISSPFFPVQPIYDRASHPAEKYETISLATGTKCLSADAMSKYGDLINDSHAEILARRGLIRFLYQEMLSALHHGSSDFLNVLSDGDHLFELKNGLEFSLVTSHTPCGDASIFPVESEDRFVIEKRKMQQDSNDVLKKRRKIDIPEEDVHRTGAKCVPDADGRVVDSHEPGKDFHVLGALRTKPGRGNPTLSMSCSDKILKWNVLGLQGTLLSNFIRPVYLDAVVIAKCPFNHESIRRSLIERAEAVLLTGSDVCQRHFPVISQSDISFPHGKYEADLGFAHQKHPCPKSILCVKTGDSYQTEVLVNGRKQGATANQRLSPSARSMVCKLELFSLFTALMEKIPTSPISIPLSLSPVIPPEPSTYNTAKTSPVSYRTSREKFMSAFPNWTKKPAALRLTDFTLKKCL